MARRDARGDVQVDPESFLRLEAVNPRLNGLVVNPHRVKGNMKERLSYKHVDYMRLVDYPIR